MTYGAYLPALPNKFRAKDDYGVADVPSWRRLAPDRAIRII